MRRIGYAWAWPLTLIGTLAARTGGAVRIDSKVDALATHGIDYCGGWFWAWWYRRIGIRGGTCGRIVIYSDGDAFRDERLRRHEGRHVEQCMVFGPLTPIVYAIGLLIGAALGHAYAWNPLEVDARRHEVP